MPGPSYAAMPDSPPETQLAKPQVVDVPPEIFQPVHIGGGWYELSDGVRVQGKDEAIKAQSSI